MSREKQIEEMVRVMNECCNRYDEQGNHIGNKCYECECWSDDNYCCCSYNTKEATALYNAGYRKQEWISVDERLPEIEGDARTWGELKIRKSVRVLCACVQKSGKTFVKEGYCEVWGDSQRAYWKIPGSIDKVTHWMPLPEAPKMKGGAE
jgi:hypothetical protein